MTSEPEEPELEYEAHGDVVCVLLKYQDHSLMLQIDLQHMNDWTAKTLIEHLLQNGTLCEPQFQEKDFILVLKKSTGDEISVPKERYLRDYTNMIDEDPDYYMELYRLPRQEGVGSST